MLKDHQYSRMILLAGCLPVFSGVVGSVKYLVQQLHSLTPINYDYGIVLGYGADMMFGMLTILIAGRLIRIEKRLDRLERAQLPLVKD